MNKIYFSAKVLKRERFARTGAPATSKELELIRKKMAFKYGGDVKIIATPIFVYTPYLTKNGAKTRRFQSLKDSLKLFVNRIFHGIRH
ncbi:MAG: hypothetical protein IKN94_07995 [Salinivirgaceae bacterium]|nr:hypothetical protein [Salinivirgaceae bacterium]